MPGLQGNPTSRHSIRLNSGPLLVERFGPIVTGGIAASFYWFMPGWRDQKINESFHDILGAALGLAGIGAGFLATAQSIIISLEDKPIIRSLKKTPYYGLIVTYLQSAIRFSCLLAVYSSAGLMIDLKEPWSQLKALYFAAWLGLTVTSILAYWCTHAHIQKNIGRRRVLASVSPPIGYNAGMGHFLEIVLYIAWLATPIVAFFNTNGFNVFTRILIITLCTMASSIVVFFLVATIHSIFGLHRF